MSTEMRTSAAEELRNLDSERKKIQEEIEKNLLILTQNKSDMTSRLVDSEGFPRADVDIYAIRTARHAIICLSNDLKDLNERIYNLLPHYYQKNTENTSKNSIPFLIVKNVKTDSSAYNAGVFLDDKILAINSLGRANLSSLDDVVQQFIACYKKSIKLEVIRGYGTRLNIEFKVLDNNDPLSGLELSYITE